MPGARVLGSDHSIPQWAQSMPFLNPASKISKDPGLPNVQSVRQGRMQTNSDFQLIEMAVAGDCPLLAECGRSVLQFSSDVNDRFRGKPPFESK